MTGTGYEGGSVSPERLEELFEHGCCGLLAAVALMTVAGFQGFEGGLSWVGRVVGDVGVWVAFLSVGFVFIGLLKADMRAAGALPERDEDLDRSLTAIVWSPANVVHEFAHGLTAVAFGGEFERVRRDDGRLGVDVHFPRGVRGPDEIGLAVTSVAPTLVGLGALAVLGDWATAAVLDPAVPRWESVARVIATSYLVRFSWPSLADLEVPVVLARQTVARLT